MTYLIDFFKNGVVVNAAAIVLGSLFGLLFKKAISKKISDSIMIGFGLVLVYIGIKGSLDGNNTLILIVSMVVGSIIGTLIDIDAKMYKMANRVEAHFKSESDGNSIAEAFVNSSLVVCVGAMAVIGSLNSGLCGDNSTLYTKAILDFIIISVYASTMGIGVIFSAVSVFLWQGAIFALSGFAEPYLSEYAISEMNCAGSILIMALGLNTLKITKIKIVNYLPAVFIPIILCLFM